MTTHHNLIVIEGLTIRQDAEGRYCLNDLHKASGGEEKDSPNRFTRSDVFISLVNELTPEMAFAPYKSQRGGLTSGTYVVKELVYAYAMWISPAFNLKVIRAFDTLQTQGVAVADHAAADFLKNPLPFVEVLLNQAKILKAERDVLEEELNVAAPKALVFDTHVANHGENLTRFVRSLKGVNTSMVKSDLARLGFLYRLGGNYRVYSKYRDVLFKEKLNVGRTKACYDIYPTAKGKEILTQLYVEGSLTLKKGFQITFGD